MKINPFLLQLEKRYLFSIIEEKLDTFRKSFPDKTVYNLGIGDIAYPLSPVFYEAFEKSLQEMRNTTIGYGPSSGYNWLKKRLLETGEISSSFSLEEIFINDGINFAISHFLELFTSPLSIGILAPTYPVYLDSSILYGHNVTVLPLTEENQFQGTLPETLLDIIFLCHPNNPTGTAFTKETLYRWIDWAKRHSCLLLVDGAYQSFITSKHGVQDIYSLEGARDVVVSFYSFSKNFGFTGLRLGYVIVPQEIRFQEMRLLDLYAKVTETKSNGVSYLTQRAGYYCLTPEGINAKNTLIQQYLHNAKQIKYTLHQLGETTFGGEDCPYVWWKIGAKSWVFFESLLNDCHILGIPGAGFGNFGEDSVVFGS